MIKTITAFNIPNDRKTLDVEIEIPSKCPICNVAYFREPVDSYWIKADTFQDQETRLYALYFCPHCEKCFLAKYRIIGANEKIRSAIVLQLYPESEAIQEFPQPIKNLSPKFVEIYHQSEKAESLGLNEICGIGYRKALEFLIKDFAIHEHQEAENTIKSAPISQCIKKYISSDTIQTLAEKSVWIGNDEAHYIRKQEERNISDMKSFIQACVYFVAMTLITEDAASMTPK